MAGWLDNIFSNLPPGRPLPGSPRRPKLPDNTPLMPVDPRAVVGGLMDQGAQGVGHAIDYATGQPVGEGFSQPTLGREAYQMLTSPTFGGGMSPMAGASTLAVAPLAARAARGARTAEEIATGARTAATESDAAAQAARAAQASPGQAALDRMTSGQAAAPTPSATDIATSGGRALTDIAPDIRRMPVDQGIAQARSEAHLVQAGQGGRSGFVGGPPDVQSYDDLVRRRSEVDAYIDQHLGGADWYDRSRAGTNEATGGDPQMNQWMSALHASMSAGVSPASETAFALRESGSRVAGVPMRGQYQNASDAFSRAIDANDPSLMQGGLKTREYGSHVGPDQPPYAPTATGVNDFRYGNLWGYRPADAETREGELSFGAPQHRWLDYETALAADRANQRQLGGRTNWTGEQIQAVPWVTQKAEDLGIPFQEANKTAPDFYPQYQVSATFETQPGKSFAESGWHLPGSVNMTPEQREALMNAPGSDWTDPTGRDVIYGGGRVSGPAGQTGVGVPTLPTLTGTGRYGDETNPQRIARPVVPMRTSSAADRMPDVPLGTKDLYPYTTNFLNTGEYIRTLFDANELGGWTKTIDKQPPGATNSVFVPLNRDARPEEMDALAKAGDPFGLPHVNSTAGGLTVQNFDGAPTLRPKQRSALLDAIGDAKPDDAGDQRMVRSVGSGVTPAYTTPGAFTATEALLGPDYMGRNPATWDFYANNQGIGGVAGQLAQRDASLPPEVGQQGQDFWNLRNLAAADPGPDGLTWADRLKTAVQKRAVPASVTIGGSTVALYPTAGLPSSLPQGQAQGTTLNSPPPDWLRQYYGGGL